MMKFVFVLIKKITIWKASSKNYELKAGILKEKRLGICCDNRLNYGVLTDSNNKSNYTIFSKGN